MKGNLDINKLEEIKYYLRDKEKIILNSQIRQNKIENQLTKLNIKKQNIIKNKKTILQKIISFVIYDIIMLLVILLFTFNIINNITSASLLATLTYIGIISIGVSGAYLSSIIDKKIIKYYNKRRINTISNKIKDIEKEINLEKNKQEMIKKEITQTINNLNKEESDKQSPNYYNENTIICKNKISSPKIKSKINHNKNH